MRRKRDIQLPMQKEGELLTSCKQILRILAGEGLLVWRRIHVMPVLRSAGNGRMKMTLNHDMAGMSDLIIWVKAPSPEAVGLVLCVELKAQRGVMSEAQQKFGAEILDSGHIYRVVRSNPEFCALLSAAGVNHWILGTDATNSQ